MVSFWDWVRDWWNRNKNTGTIGDPRTAINFDISDLIAETYATEEFGKGFFFETQNAGLLSFFLEMAKNNNLEQLIWRLIKTKNLNGSGVLKFETLGESKNDVSIYLVKNFSATKVSSKLIQIEIDHFPIQMVGEKTSFYKIKEYWTDAHLTRFFMYNKQTLSFSTWAEKIPKKFQFNLNNNDFKYSKNSEPKHEYRIKNPFKMIPMKVFENIDARPDLPEAEKWNLWINKIIAEIRYDTIISRPFFQIGTIDTSLQDYLTKYGLPKGIFLTNKIVNASMDTKFQVIAAPNRIQILIDQIEFILKMAFNKSNSSYSTQLERVPARAEELANSKGSRTVAIKRKIFENDLKIFLQQIFDHCGFKKISFDIKMMPNANSPAQNIEENIRKKAFGLVDSLTATAEVAGVDQKKAEDIQAKIKKENPGETPGGDKKTEVSVEGKTNTDFQKK